MDMIVNYLHDEHQAQWTQELEQEVNTGGQVVVGQTCSMHTQQRTQPQGGGHARGMDTETDNAKSTKSTIRNWNR